MDTLVVFTDGQNIFMANSKKELPSNCPPEAWLIGTVINFTGSFNPTMSFTLDKID